MSGDGLTMTSPAPFLVDPVDPTQLLIGTCRLWRGPGQWNRLDQRQCRRPRCSTETADQFLLQRERADPLDGRHGASRAAGEVVYVGMYGSLNGGGTSPGHVLSATMNASGAWSAVA